MRRSTSFAGRRLKRDLAIARQGGPAALDRLIAADIARARARLDRFGLDRQHVAGSPALATGGRRCPA